MNCHGELCRTMTCHPSTGLRMTTRFSKKLDDVLGMGDVRDERLYAGNRLDGGQVDADDETLRSDAFFDVLKPTPRRRPEVENSLTLQEQFALPVELHELIHGASAVPFIARLSRPMIIRNVWLGHDGRGAIGVSQILWEVRTHDVL